MIEKGKKVELHYTLRVDDQVLESSREGDPLVYVHGEDNVIKGLQMGLEGKNEGDKCTIQVRPEDGYGAKNPEAIVEVGKDKVPDEALKLGATIAATAKGGEKIRGLIQDIRPETVLIDFNHPLAGKILSFDIEILSVSLGS